MPRSKKTAFRGRGKGAYRGNAGRLPELATSFLSFPGSGTRHEGNGYSLQSEAFYTQQRDQSSGDSDRRLRHTKVTFVSAEDSQISEVTMPETGLAHMTLNEISSKAQADDGGETKVDVHLKEDSKPSGLVDEARSLFIIDTQGSEPVITGLPQPQIRSTSPTLSSSSDEVIVFAGRDKAGRGLSIVPHRETKTADSYDSQITLIEDKIHENQILLGMTGDQAEQSPPAQQSTVDGCARPQRGNADTFCPANSMQPVTSMPKTKGTRGSRLAQSHHSRKIKREHERVLIDDYISNLDTQELDPKSMFNQRDLGGTDSDFWQETETSSIDPSKMSSLNEWGRLELGDLNSISTSNEVLGSVQAILSKRNQKNCEQYLVVWEDNNVGEAHWVPSSSLVDVNSMKLIAEFEAEQKLTTGVFSEGERDTDSDTDIDSAHDEDNEDSDDDAYLLQRKIDRMTDEKIAKLLTKQEELGMGSSGLVLFDDSPETGLDDRDTMSYHALKSGRHSFRKVRRANGDFPAASILADAYDGFDVMDFDRPSLRKKPKGRRGRLEFDLSDSELEASVSMAWDKDRARKREKKDERQALRVLGLLGKKNTKADLKAKYREGMDIHAVKVEIKHFLKGYNTTLALPPMDKADRKVVHEMANAFNLKSKSAGKGNKRFPVLYRTPHTSSFSEAKFAAVESGLTRRYLPSMNLKGRNLVSVPKRSGRGGGFSNGAVSYRDGDIVGGSAPELGVENKGRAMLEKMGWSNGTALGAVNNKGILQPVSHVVKTNKAGLG